jgi:2-polyprenyl-3-methyl-5-hydroxy-6-metoxy-1,4-benzoquinol methylase
MDSQDWDQRYDQTDLVWSEGPNRFVEEIARELPPGRALDLACGEGRNAIWLARQGWTVTGVDFSAVAIEKARRLGESAGVAVEWRCADVVTFKPQAASFDFVLLSYLQLPAREMAEVVASGSRALAPGGSLLVVGHARANLTDGTGGPQDPDVLYEPDDVGNWLRDVEVLRAEHVIRTLNTETGLRQAIDTLVLARRKGE